MSLRDEQALEQEASPSHAWRLEPQDWWMLGILVGVKLIIHIATSGSYGYFRDELYFLDCGRHLSWGYVDDAPMIPFIFRIALMLGGSLHLLRIIAAIAGAGALALSMVIARQLGGGRFAQCLTGLCMLAATPNLWIDSTLCTAAIEPLFWMGCVYILIRIVRTGDSSLWLWFGLWAGLGLENKYTLLIFGLAVLVALLMTRQRGELLKPWIWIAAGIAMLIFLPTLLWQIRNGFPVIEDVVNTRHLGTHLKNGPIEFLKEQIINMNPILFPVWLAGLWSLLLGRGARLRILGWIYLCCLLMMIVLRTKYYYLVTIYPMLFAAGAVAFESWLNARARSRGRIWGKAAIAGLITLDILILAPAMLPFLPPAELLAYQKRLGISAQDLGAGHDGPLPIYLGDQFGWEQLVKEVAGVYYSLPPDERTQTTIYTVNYGEAAAINHFGPGLGLPTAYSAHQAEWFWGPPESVGKIFICLGGNQEILEKYYQSVTKVAEHFHPWGMKYENGPIFLCRGPRFSLKKVWPQLRLWYSNNISPHNGALEGRFYS